MSAAVSDDGMAVRYPDVFQSKDEIPEWLVNAALDGMYRSHNRRLNSIWVMCGGNWELCDPGNWICFDGQSLSVRKRP